MRGSTVAKASAMSHYQDVCHISGGRVRIFKLLSLNTSTLLVRVSRNRSRVTIRTPCRLDFNTKTRIIKTILFYFSIQYFNKPILNISFPRMVSILLFNIHLLLIISHLVYNIKIIGKYLFLILNYIFCFVSFIDVKHLFWNYLLLYVWSN